MSLRHLYYFVRDDLEFLRDHDGVSEPNDINFEVIQNSFSY